MTRLPITATKYSDVLDLFIVSPYFYSRKLFFEVIKNELDSDHFPLFCSFIIDSPTSAPTSANTASFNFYKADWSKFAKSLNECNPPSEPNNIDSLNSWITSSILSPANLSIPKARYSNGCRRLPQEILNLINERHEIRRKIRAGKDPGLKPSFNKLSREIKLGLIAQPNFFFRVIAKRFFRSL